MKFGLQLQYACKSNLFSTTKEPQQYTKAEFYRTVEAVSQI